ncbi:MAG: symmetrical bis(5'-nucleosyl)-tetraphosphatase [Methylobacillus sp.]|jgi:bis(5'-nucleosyl)-tetraphosphatase (symmetrical)|nr:symmetrical bis(5'-nucleosyl)-tetraphosphatase [Methylobacillus sp.]
MATYAIGDIQGCYASLRNLLEAIGFSASRDTLWLVGDLINRGPDSLAVLRWAKAHESRLRVVLGNHDLHALAVAEGVAEAHRRDTLQPLLDAPDGGELLAWLRHGRMAYGEDEYLMVHAGLLPQWSGAQVTELAHEVEAALRGANYREFFARMYGNQPDHWRDDLRGMDRLRLITNALTRLRVCDAAGVMDFDFKGEPTDIPAGLMPWFDAPKRNSADKTVIFGHWSALGLVLRDHVIALDTGCLWGGRLTALRLEDRRLFQVPCAKGDAIGKQ